MVDILYRGEHRIANIVMTLARLLRYGFASPVTCKMPRSSRSWAVMRRNLYQLYGAKYGQRWPTGVMLMVVVLFAFLYSCRFRRCCQRI